MSNIDLNKLYYADLDSTIIDRLQNDGKEIKQIGTYEDFLKLEVNDEYKKKQEEIKIQDEIKKSN